MLHLPKWNHSTHATQHTQNSLQGRAKGAEQVQEPAQDSEIPVLITAHLKALNNWAPAKQISKLAFLNSHLHSKPEFSLNCTT